VIGIGRFCEIGQVTAGAIRRRSGKTSVDVASHAVNTDMGASQPELSRVVIEGRTLPIGGGMTSAAIVREGCGHVIWICRCGIVLRMTAVALRGSTLEPVPGVTRCARQLSVCARQAEVRELSVVEFSALPLVHAVTCIAGHRKISCHMIHRTRLLEITLVAADARCTQADKLAAGSTLVARIALQRCMRAQ